MQLLPLIVYLLLQFDTVHVPVVHVPDVVLHVTVRVPMPFVIVHDVDG